MRRGGAVAPRPQGKNTRTGSVLLENVGQGSIGTAAPTVLSDEESRIAQKESEYQDWRRGQVAEKRMGVANMTNPLLKKAGRKTRRTTRKLKKVSRRR
jgi:hypothetical protein